MGAVGVFLDGEGLLQCDLTMLRQECESLTLHDNTPPAEIVARLTGATVCILNKVVLTREHMQALPELRLVCVAATGTDVVDIGAANELGITVCNCRAYGTDSVVQHVFALILALNTSLLKYHRAVQGGRWQQASQFCFLDYPIRELRGKVLGLVGHGTLGQGVARIAESFGMRVVVAARPGRRDDPRPALSTLLPEVDVLSLHCPLTPDTRNVIGSKELALMKRGALLVNAARGGLVDEEALAAALRSGHLGGAAIDVLSSEPPRQGNPLLDADLPNLIVTPHIAWASEEARQRIIDQTVENIRSFRSGEPIRVVSPPP